MSRVKRSWLVGGEQEVQDAIDGLLLAGQGARVLIHGSPGMGKDVVASEVVRDPRITNCPGVHYQKWLVASTDTDTSVSTMLSGASLSLLNSSSFGAASKNFIQSLH